MILTWRWNDIDNDSICLKFALFAAILAAPLCESLCRSDEYGQVGRFLNECGNSRRSRPICMRWLNKTQILPQIHVSTYIQNRIVQLHSATKTINKLEESSVTKGFFGSEGAFHHLVATQDVSMVIITKWTIFYGSNIHARFGCAGSLGST